LRNLPLRAALCSGHELADTPASQEGRHQQEEKKEGGRDRVADVVATHGRGRDHVCGGKDSRDSAPDGRGWVAEIAASLPLRSAAQAAQLGLSEQTSDNWSQIMLYAQWVLYGLYATVAMKWKPLWKVWIQVAVVHLLGFSVLWLLARK
jgi:hypothetical protein